MVEINLSIIDITVICFYITVLVLLGLILKSKGQEDLFLGGRNLNWPSIGFSLFSANVTPVMLISFAGLAYSHGVVGSNFEWLAWPFLLLLTMIFAPYYLYHEISTMPDFLRLRFGKKSYRFMSFYALINILVVWIAGSLYAGGIIISQILEVPLWVSMSGISFLAASYTAIGGLNAIVRTDVFQSMVILTSSIILTFLALNKIGGINSLVESVPSSYWDLTLPASDPDYPWHAIFLGYPVVGVSFWCTDQFIVQKILAARNLKQSQYGAIFTSFLKLTIPFIFLFPGIMAYVLYPDLAMPDHAYMTLVMDVLPQGLVGLAVAALLAALINTVAAGLNSFSTVFTLDIFSDYVAPGANKKTLKHVGQVSIIVAALISIAMGIGFKKSGKDLFDIVQGVMSLLAPPLASVFLVGVLWKRTNNIAAISILYGGGLVCSIIGMCYVFSYPSAEFWPHFLLLSFYLFVLCVFILVIISLLTTPTDGKALASIKETYKLHYDKMPEKIVGLWGTLALIMISLYFIFN